MPAIRVSIQLRWSDLDGYGHINNVAIVGLLEQARVLALWSDADPILPPLTADADTWVLVAGLEVAFKKVIHHRTEPILAEVSVTKCSGASFVIGYRLIVDGDVCATATTTMALIDASTGAPARVGPQLRARLLEFSAED